MNKTPKIHQQLISLVFTAMTFVFFFSCGKSKCDETTPSISFKEFRQYRDAQGKLLDSAKIIITFKDCDGDIGLTESDSVAPYEFNFELQYYEMINGVWAGCPKKDSGCYFRYRIPLLEPEGKNKVVEGEMGITIPLHYNYFSSLNSDTVKFEAQLFDRALNGSNIIETPMILTK